MSAQVTKTNGRAPRSLAPAVEAGPRKPDGLMDALLAVQAAADKLERNADGQIQSRGYKYVTLGKLMDAVQPLLTDHALVWVTLPTADEHGNPAITYRLTHVPSGQALEDTMPLMCSKPDPQGQGSAITYARRYALMAVLNMATEDDDGSAASAPVDRYAEAAAAHERLEQERDQARAPQPSARAPQPSERQASPKQQNMLRAKARAASLTAPQLANVLKEARGEPLTQWSSDDAAARFLEMAIDRLPARLVDAVIAGIAHAGAEGSRA